MFSDAVSLWFLVMNYFKMNYQYEPRASGTGVIELGRGKSYELLLEKEQTRANFREAEIKFNINLRHVSHLRFPEISLLTLPVICSYENFCFC